MSYWLDSSTDATEVTGAALDTTVVAPTGAHIVHVQATGEGGSTCVGEVAVTVFSLQAQARSCHRTREHQ